MRRHAKAIVAISVMLLTLALGVTLATAVAPSVTIENASEVKYTTAKAKGTVDPGDHFTEYHFEAATEADFSNVSAFAGFGSFGENEGVQPTPTTEFTELQPGTTYHVRLVASNEDGPAEAVATSTFTTEAVATPTVTIEPVSSVTGDSAHFEGMIEPNAPKVSPGEFPEEFDVRWRFDCTPNCPGVEGNQTITADDTEHTVQGDATDLDPNVDYDVILIAENAGGESSAGPEEFKTLAIGPEAFSLPASGITETTAIVGGLVDPNGSPTSYYVEYATQPDFSDAISFPASEDGNAGSGPAPVSVSLRIVDLQPETEYFFRVVANGFAADTSGAQDFRTLASLPPSPACPNAQFRVGPSAALPECRAFERITPQDKNGGNAEIGVPFDADHIGFTAAASFIPGDPNRFGGSAQYLGTRTPNGWSVSAQPSGQALEPDFIDDNDAFSQTIIQADRKPLTPDDVDSAWDVYARSGGGLRLVSVGSMGGTADDNASYVGQSADGSHLLFASPERLEPADADRDEGLQLYERQGNQTSVVGVLPDDECASLSLGPNCVDPGGAVLGNGFKNESSAPNAYVRPSGSSDAISKDGSVIFFESPDPALEVGHQLYARVDGNESVAVSATQCDRIAPGCDDDGYKATFQGAADDGSRVYFTSEGQLTSDDLNSRLDLYRFDLSEESLSRVTSECHTADGSIDDCEFTQLSGVIHVSSDGNLVYFSTANSPPRVPDFGVFASAPQASIYLYEGTTGESIFVANIRSEGNSGSLFQGGLSEPPSEADVTPSGNVLVFASPLQLTSSQFQGGSCPSLDENANPDGASSGECVEIYRYEASSRHLLCVSCNDTGTMPVGRAAIEKSLSQRRGGSPVAGQKQATIVSDDGRTIAFSSADALDPRDSNGRYDVYEWHDGRLHLLTLGSSSEDSELAGISRDAHGIFIRTPDQLVPSDTDFQKDLYIARVGGGLSQDHPRLAAPCEADGCKTDPATPPLGAAPATSSFIGPGNTTRRPRCRKGKVRRRGTCVRPTRHKKRGQAKQSTSNNRGDK